MSYDRACYCGKERWEYEECNNPNCSWRKREEKVSSEFERGFSKAVELLYRNHGPRGGGSIGWVDAYCFLLSHWSKMKVGLEKKK